MWSRIYFLLIYVFSLNVSSSAQSELPYKEIPSYPANYTQSTVISRMIDGLGYRYYWATENLRDWILISNPIPLLGQLLRRWSIFMVFLL